MAKWPILWIGSIAVFVILGFLTPGAFAADAWCDLSTCDTNWTLRKKITIDNTKVSGTSHSDFAVLVSLSSDTDLKSSNVQSEGEDIRFTNEDGSAVLSYEIESFSNDGTDGTLVAWVKIPTLSATADTVLYMYYGNSGAGSTANAASVWNTNYVGVYHMNGTGNVIDSTSNGNDGTKVSSLATVSAKTNIDLNDWVTTKEMINEVLKQTYSDWARKNK